MLNEIKSRKEREYLEAQDRYADMGREIFQGIAKSLQAIDWLNLKPSEMEKLAKIAHAFELGEDTGKLQNYNNGQEDNSKALDSDARERMKKIYEDSLKKQPVPKKIKKMKQLNSEE